MLLAFLIHDPCRLQQCRIHLLLEGDDLRLQLSPVCSLKDSPDKPWPAPPADCSPTSKPMVAAVKMGASAGASSAAVESTVATALCKAGVQLTMFCATPAAVQPCIQGSGISSAINIHAPSFAVLPCSASSADCLWIFCQQPEQRRGQRACQRHHGAGSHFAQRNALLRQHTGNTRDRNEQPRRRRLRMIRRYFLKFMVHTPPSRGFLRAAYGISVESVNLPLCFFVRAAGVIQIRSPTGHAHPLEALSRSRCCRGSGPASNRELLAQTKTVPSPGAHPRARFSGSAPLKIQGHSSLGEPRQEGEHIRPARHFRTLSGYELRIRNWRQIIGKLGKAVSG